MRISDWSSDVCSSDLDKGALYYPSIDQFQSFVIRRSDRLIWVHLCVRNNRGGLAIAETTPLEITASLLPASEMKQQLDDDGKVSVQVNFAVDKADILPDSKPQDRKSTRLNSSH